MVAWMSQFDAHGRFIRSARYNLALMAIWQRQVPYGRIIVESSTWTR